MTSASAVASCGRFFTVTATAPTDALLRTSFTGTVAVFVCITKTFLPASPAVRVMPRVPSFPTGSTPLSPVGAPPPSGVVTGGAESSLLPKPPHAARVSAAPTTTNETRIDIEASPLCQGSCRLRRVAA
jgi:hypothetical protein